MNIVILGYGRMGRFIETIAQERGHTVTARIDNFASDADATSLKDAHLQNADSVIEFALPEGLKENVALCAKHGVPHIIGTTGWNDIKEEIITLVTENNGAMLYGSNFSVGANLFFALCEKAAQLVDPYSDYDLMMYELHHKMKQDSPSGTALTAAEKVIAKSSRKSKIQTQALNRKIEDNELHVASVRGGSIPGTHTLLLDSIFDTIEVTHTARTRQGFALGSVLAAEWMQGKKGIYTIDDYFKEKL